MAERCDPLMIVTDLDGSLLDHHTYRWEPAQHWLDRLKVQGVPLVICSSKTAAEIIPLQHLLGIEDHPFIAENGAVVHWEGADGPHGSVATQNYAEICAVLNSLRDKGFKFIGFADVTANEVAQWTGLPPHDAALAMQRQGSESIIWRDAAERFEPFREALRQQGLDLIPGGRFWSVMSIGADKAAALTLLLTHYGHSSGKKWLTLGLGDGPNDVPMLDNVDLAVVIRGYSKLPVELTRQDSDQPQKVFYSTRYGPEGWSEGLSHFLADAKER